jgi:inosine/xanthosine triphosphate pyrophosphatase family protein
VFVDPATGVTFAELTPEQKNERSHRRRAVDVLMTALG